MEDLNKTNINNTQPNINTPMDSTRVLNQSPINLPEKQPDTSYQNVNTLTNAYPKNQVQKFEQEIQALKDKDQSANQVTNLMGQIFDIEQNKDKIANELGADKNLNEYRRLGTEIDLENERTRQAIEALDSSGMFAGTADSQATRLQRESANRKAILTIQRSAALGDYESAVNIAKAKVEMQVAPLKAQLEQLKYVQEYNKDFRTAELNALIKKKDNEIKREEERLTKGEEMIINALQSKAPSNLVSKAREIIEKGGTQADVVAVLGNYSMSQDERLSNAIKTEQLNALQTERKSIENAKKTGLLSKEQAKTATDLRKEYNNLEGVKGVNKSETDTKSIVSALASGKPTDDIAAINSFQRIAVDPGVAVREGDVALLQSAMSFGDKTWLKTQGYLKGNKLTDVARADMQKLALEIHDARINSVIEQTAPIRKTADVYGIPFDEYIGAPLKKSSSILEEIEKTQIPPEIKSENYTSNILNKLTPEPVKQLGDNSFSDLFNFKP